MKVQLTFKDPDGVYESINDAVERSRPDGLSDAEWEGVKEVRHDELSGSLKKFIEFGEYLRVEIDTDAGTATVKEI